MKVLRHFVSYCKKLLIKLNRKYINISTIVILLIAVAVITAYTITYKTNIGFDIIGIQDSKVTSFSKEATASAEIPKGLLGNILKPVKSPIAKPTTFLSPTPTPKSSVNSTVPNSSFKSSSARVYLNPPSGSSTPEGTGQVLIELSAIDPYYTGKIASFRVNGGVAKLKPNASYWLAFSPPNDLGGATGVLDFTTNEVGAAAVSVSGKGISYYPSGITWFIGVYPKGNASVAAIKGSFSISNDTILVNNSSSPTNTPTVRLISIVSPKREATYKFGELIPVEIKVGDESNISKVDLAWGRLNYSFVVMKTFTNPPFTHSFRVTENSPYIVEDDKRLNIGVYLYDRNGNYVGADLIKVVMIQNDFNVAFKTPKDDETISGTNTLTIEAEVTGNKEIEKVEFYAGSGALIQTLTTKPYSFNYDISNLTCCITSKYSLPLTVRAYDKEGNNISQSINVYISKN